MIYIQHEHDEAATSIARLKIKQGDRLLVLYNMATGESFLESYNVTNAGIIMGNPTYSIPTLAPITFTDYTAGNILEGIRMCDGEVVHDSTGNPIKDQYQVMETIARYDMEIETGAGSAGNFLFVSVTDANNNLVGIANFTQM